MSVGIVDLLEVIEVHHHQGHGLTGQEGKIDLFGQHIIKSAAVVQQGQGIEVDLLAQGDQVGTQAVHALAHQFQLGLVAFLAIAHHL